MTLESEPTAFSYPCRADQRNRRRRAGSPLHAESVAPTGVVALPEDLRLTQPPVQSESARPAVASDHPLFLAGAGVGDFHRFLFLTAMGFVPLHHHVIFVGHL